MRGFTSLDVKYEREWNPIYFKYSTGRPVIKYPQGRKDPAYDFGIPNVDAPAEQCNLTYYLPNWQVLICLRHPLDVLVSRHPENINEYRVSPERYFGALKRDLAALQHPNTKAVFYEKLVKNPSRVMSDIANFIKEEYDFEIINNFYKESSQPNQITIALNGLRPIDTKSINNWQKPEHAKRVAAIWPYYKEHIEPLWDLVYGSFWRRDSWKMCCCAVEQ